LLCFVSIRRAFRHRSCAYLHDFVIDSGNDPLSRLISIVFLSICGCFNSFRSWPSFGDPLRLLHWISAAAFICQHRPFLASEELLLHSAQQSAFVQACVLLACILLCFNLSASAF